MSKFNLKQMKLAAKKAINTDEHITMRLKEQHEKAPNQVTERQLDDNRFDTKDVTIEKQLEKVRMGSETGITEYSLNTNKGKFSPLRNDKAAKGDINKLEEKRLAGKPVEEEKYEVASGVQKKLKWWEGLKTASDLKKNVKLAQTNTEVDALTEEEERRRQRKNRGGVAGIGGGKAESFERLRGMVGEEEGLVPDVASEPVDAPVSETMGGETSAYEPALPTVLKIVSKEENPNGTDVIKIPHIKYTFSYNPGAFNGNDAAVKAAAMNTLNKENPELAALVDESDFNVSKKHGSIGMVFLRLIGEEYFTQGKDAFADVSVETVDNAGTPTIVGRVTLTEEGKKLATEDPEAFAQQLTDFVATKNRTVANNLPEEGLKDYIDFGAFAHGEVTFAIGQKAEVTGPELESETPVSGEGVAAPASTETAAQAEEEADSLVSLPLEGGKDDEEEEAETTGGEEIQDFREKTPEEIARMSPEERNWYDYNQRPEQVRERNRRLHNPKWQEEDERKKLRRPQAPKARLSETDFPIITADSKKN